MKKIITVYLLTILISFTQNLKAQSTKPNVIVILVDDFGYECVQAYGGTSYATPNINRLASQGIRFEHAYAQPLCTPSRVKIMTGKTNVKNYTKFGRLKEGETTFANLFRDNGYATCIAGKWQLSDGPQVLNDFGFDNHCLWQQYWYSADPNTATVGRCPRFKDPLLMVDGQPQSYPGLYGPDIASDYINNFIDANKDKPFLVYYPMILTHSPFVPTPDSGDDWNKDEPAQSQLTLEQKQKYFADMTAYTDKIVAKIEANLIKNNILENTIILFTGDNGTHHDINSALQDGTNVQGGKGDMTDAGTRVPLIAYWKDRSVPSVSQDLVDLGDFLPTICEAANIDVPNDIDGVSFLPQILGQTGTPKDYIFMWYAQNGKSKDAKMFTRTQKYKLYGNGDFFNIENDVLEQNKLIVSQLSQEAYTAYLLLKSGLRKYNIYHNQRYIDNVSWTSQAITGEAQVSNEGQLVEALNFASGETPSLYNTTLNGVTFTGFTNGSTTNSFENPTANHFTGNSNAVSNTDNYEIPPGLSAFDVLMSNALFGPVNDTYNNIVTLDNLDVGQEYEVQLFFGKTGGVNRYTIVDNGSDVSFGSASLTNYGANGSDAIAQSTGGNVITGRFLATSTMLSFSLDAFTENGIANNAFFLNAYQLRNLTPAKASNILWDARPIIDASTVSNKGVLLEALNFSSGTVASDFNSIVNGVAFTGFVNGNSSNSAFPLPTAGYFSSNSAYVSTDDAYTAPPGLSDFDVLLSRWLYSDISGSFGNTVTLSNLNVGEAYEVQLFFGKTTGANRHIVIDDGTSGSFGSITTTNYGASTTGSTSSNDFGTSIVGTFVATESEKSFSISSYTNGNLPGAPFFLNAYQLRNLGSATISWEARPIQNAASVSTNGGFVEALNFSAGVNAQDFDTVINGVLFKGFVNGDAANSSMPSPSANNFSANSAYVSTPDAYDAPPGSPDFDTLLSRWLYSDFDNGFGNVVTLNNLIVGEAYEVQLFFGKTSGANRHIVINDGTLNAFGSSTTTNFGASTSGSTSSNDFGTSIIGTFIATGSTKSFTINSYVNGNLPGAPFFLNAYQLRRPNYNNSSTSQKAVNENNKAIDFKAEKLINTGGLKVYPNPSDKILFIVDGKGNELNGVYKIHDVSGRLVKQDILAKQSQGINVSDLKSGLYIINIKSDNIVRTFKVMVDH